MDVLNFKITKGVISTKTQNLLLAIGLLIAFMSLVVELIKLGIK